MIEKCSRASHNRRVEDRPEVSLGRSCGRSAAARQPVYDKASQRSPGLSAARSSWGAAPTPRRRCSVDHRFEVNMAQAMPEWTGKGPVARIADVSTLETRRIAVPEADLDDLRDRLRRT